MPDVVSDADRKLMEVNREGWDLRAAVHIGTKLYDEESFKNGRSSLRWLEMDEVGDVAGRSLLHMQCHLGQDALSWVRLGAVVTGADFSTEAIGHARRLAGEMGLEARFICSNVYDLPEVLHEQFDVVFVNYGSLSYLPDLEAWARVVAHFLKPGGRFSIVEIHPFITVFREVDGQLRITYPLFRQEPYEWKVNVTCADASPVPPHPEFSWPWTVGSLVTALLGAGLRIDRLRELPIDARQRMPSMIKDDDSYWHLPGDPFPLVVACSAVKPT